MLGLKTKVAQLYHNFKSLLGTAAEFQTANEGTSSWRNVSRRMEVSVSPGLALCCVKCPALPRDLGLVQEPGGCWLCMHWCGPPCHCQTHFAGVHPCRRARCSLPNPFPHAACNLSLEAL